MFLVNDLSSLSSFDDLRQQHHQQVAKQTSMTIIQTTSPFSSICVLQFGEFSKEMSLVTIKIIEVGSPECRSAIFYTVQSKYPSKLLSISFQMINSDVMISLLRMQLEQCVVS